MQFRFREYDEEKDTYNFITAIDIDDYDVMVNALMNIKNNKNNEGLEVNIEDIVDTVGEYYDIESVALCVSKEIGEEALVPHFVVDIKETY